MASQILGAVAVLIGTATMKLESHTTLPECN